MNSFLTLVIILAMLAGGIILISMSLRFLSFIYICITSFTDEREEDLNNFLDNYAPDRFDKKDK